MFSSVRSGLVRCVAGRSGSKSIGGDVHLGCFGRMFLAPGHESEYSAKVLESQVRAQATTIDKDQPGYHPVYGFTADFPAKRQDLLTRNARRVSEYLDHVRPKHQLRILDVGCNCGYVSFLLAEKFSNVVGLEIAKDRVALCRNIAAYSKSTARFFHHDFVQSIEKGNDDLENIDAVLLLNVVHQFIFNYGFSYTQALIARLVRRVDVVFIELAKREQYVRHNKDHLLPENPEEVFALCEDVEITLLESSPRPFYVLRRKKAYFSHIEIEPESIDFSLNADEQISRKYYANSDKFLKLYRFTERQSITSFHQEVSALLRMGDSKISPTILDWVETRDFAAVMMKRIAGPRLVQLIYKPEFNNHDKRYKMTCEYLRIAKSVFDCIGFQNDMQAHNLIVSDVGTLVLIDYEQATDKPTNDPFGILLWTLFDIWGGKTAARPEAIRSLRLLDDKRVRAKGAIYPDFSDLSLNDEVRALVNDAQNQPRWGEFLSVWHQRLFSQNEENN